MQQSPTISVEQELSSVTFSENPSEISSTKTNQFDKWRSTAKRIVRFFRFIKIPVLRTRFIDTVSRISGDYFASEELRNYETNKIREDFHFLDDIKRYQEVFNTFSSVGFVWHDKEFRLAKLKANYIYERYMSTREAIAKTNIPPDTILLIYNRTQSPRTFSSLTYLNIFNDAEKFIVEKLLMIYMREGPICFSVMSPKKFIPIMNRSKENRIMNQTISSLENSKEINRAEKSISIRSDIKRIGARSKEPQYDEVITPNWTYSTASGVVYNPIREKRLKVTKRSLTKRTKDFDSSGNSLTKPSHDASNDSKMIDATVKNTPSAMLSKQMQNSHGPISTTRRKHPNDYSRSFSDNFVFRHQHANRSPSSYYRRCDGTLTRNTLERRQTSKRVFICQVHASSQLQSQQTLVKNEASYRMALIA